MPLPNSQQIPETDIIRKIKEVSDHNAGLLIHDVTVTDTGFSLLTNAGDTLDADLAEKFYTREEGLNANEVPPASEDGSGRIAIASDAEAIAGEDDSKAMTAAKTLLQLLNRGVPRFELTDGLAGQSLLIELVEGQLVIKPGSPIGSLLALVSGATNADRSAALLALLNAADVVTKARFCELVGSCAAGPVAPAPTWDSFIHYELIPDAVAPTVTQLGRIDANRCAVISGWVYGGDARIVVNGQTIATVQPTIDRSGDVVPYLLNTYGIVAPSGMLGYAFYKPATYNNGQPYNWQVFVGNSQIECTTDTGAPVALTCGVPTNPMPTLNNPAPDRTWSALGVNSFQLPTDEFTDNPGDPGTLFAYRYDAGFNGFFALPSWLTFTPSTRTFSATLDFSIPNQVLSLRMIYADSAGQAAVDDFTLTLTHIAN